MKNIRGSFSELLGKAVSDFPWSNEADEAGLILESLLERRRSEVNPASYSSGLERVLGPKWFDFRPTDDEYEEALRRLIERTHLPELPSLRTVRAISMCPDIRTLGPLRWVFGRALAAREDLVIYAAMRGILQFPVEEPAVLETARMAASEGSGDVREDAQHYLDFYG